MKLVFSLPTCEPQTMFKNLLPSVKYMLPIKDLVEFCICFQPPYTEEEIQKVLKGFEGLNVKWIYKKYNFEKPFTPLMQMRNDCAMLEPDADYYALLDDDMQFLKTIDEYYKKAIEDLDEHPNLAVISFTDTYSNAENYFYTNRGIIYRGGKYYGFKGLIPHKLLPNTITRVEYEGEDLLELYGGHQDKFCAMIRLATGQTAKQYCRVPTLHNEIRKLKGAFDHGWIEAEGYPKSIVNFIKKYFREDYEFNNGKNCWDEKIRKQLYHMSEVQKCSLPENENELIVCEGKILPISFEIKFDLSITKKDEKDDFKVMKFYDENQNEVFSFDFDFYRFYVNIDNEHLIRYHFNGILYEVCINFSNNNLYINGNFVKDFKDTKITSYKTGIFTDKEHKEIKMEVFNVKTGSPKEVLIVGHGIVGKLEERILAKSKLAVTVYDVNEPFYGDIEKYYDLAVICVPTETIDGKCDISQVENAIETHKAGLYLIRSTVAVGTCRKLAEKYGKRIVFSPEHSGSTQHCTNFEYNFSVFGGDKRDCFAVQQIYQEVYDAYHIFRVVDFETAELAKYMENAYLATKVSFCREFYEVCQKLGLNYEELRECFVLDPRIEASHTYIYDDHAYYDSHCLNKDVPVIANQFDMPILKKIIEENEKAKKN